MGSIRQKVRDGKNGSDILFLLALPGLKTQQEKKKRGLLRYGWKPLRLIVLGPPLTGKTSLCRRLCEHYHLVYVNAGRYLCNLFVA